MVPKFNDPVTVKEDVAGIEILLTRFTPVVFETRIETAFVIEPGKFKDCSEVPLSTIEQLVPEVFSVIVAELEAIKSPLRFRVPSNVPAPIKFSTRTIHCFSKFPPTLLTFTISVLDFSTVSKFNIVPSFLMLNCHSQY